MSSGVVKRVKRWAEVDTRWKEFLEQKFVCKNCKQEVFSPQENVNRPNDRILTWTHPDTKGIDRPVSSVTCYCRGCYAVLSSNGLKR